MRVLTLAAMLILLTSCGSEDPVQKEDSVLYTDIIPDEKMTSMISYPVKADEVTKNNVLFLSGQGAGPIISAARTLYEIDLNQDNTNDFEFVVNHTFAPEFGLTEDRFLIYLGSWYINEVSLVEGELGYLRKYVHGEELDLESFGRSARYSFNCQGGFLYKDDWDDNFTGVGQFYIGVRVEMRGKWHYGWILVETDFLSLTVKEFAVSKLPETTIRAGQKH